MPKRRLESELLAAFERERPRILGALLDAIATGLGQLATVRLERLPRMADFAKWAVACERAVFDDGAFMEAYTGNRTEAVSAVIDASPVASAIRHLMESRPEPWEGTPGRALRRAEPYRRRARDEDQGMARERASIEPELEPHQLGAAPGGDRRRQRTKRAATSCTFPTQPR